MDARKTVAEYLKLDVANITVHVTLLGGAFGRKSKPDFICEAAYLSREVGAPVRVQWTREDDLRHSYLHSPAAHIGSRRGSMPRARSSPGVTARRIRPSAPPSRPT
jgi:CO/xanthine dehydrogenase Mo-binding subunit